MEKEAQAYKQIKEGQPITDQQHTEVGLYFAQLFIRQNLLL